MVLNEAYSVYQQHTTEEKRHDVEQTKKELEHQYNIVEEECLQDKIKLVEEAHINRKHGQSWILVNDISGRRTTKKGQIKGNSQQERIQNWLKHFKGLLGAK